MAKALAGRRPPLFPGSRYRGPVVFFGSSFGLALATSAFRQCFHDLLAHVLEARAVRRSFGTEERRGGSRQRRRITSRKASRTFGIRARNNLRALQLLAPSIRIPFVVALFVLQGRLPRTPHVFYPGVAFFAPVKQGSTTGEEPRPARGRGAQDEALDFAEHCVERRDTSQTLLRAETRKQRGKRSRSGENLARNKKELATAAARPARDVRYGPPPGHVIKR